MKADYNHPTVGYNPLTFASLFPFCVLRLFCVLAAALAVLSADAGGWPATPSGWFAGWISHPDAAAGEQVWFRRCFTGEGRTVNGRIEVVTDGTAVVFVNGYNVTADVPPPLPDRPSGEMWMMRYDVTRYLRPDSNVVAVRCSPAAPADLSLALHGTPLLVPADSLSVTGTTPVAPRLRLVFSGLRVTHGGRRAAPFSYTTDDTWLCRTAGCRLLEDGVEWVDGRTAVEDWRPADVEIMKWRNAREEAAVTVGRIVEEAPLHRAVRVGRVRECGLIGAAAGRLTYGCGPEFCGRLRVTLRGMKSGDVLRVGGDVPGSGGMRYVCSGEADEQAVMRFTEYEGASVTVSCDTGLTPDNVTKVETLSLEDYFHDSWMY